MASEEYPMQSDDGDLWERIGKSLLTERTRLVREIASYPTPIAGCDQQFNHLLELQAAFPGEWARYEAAKRAGRDAGDSSAMEFLATCRLLDEAAKARLAG